MENANAKNIVCVLVRFVVYLKATYEKLDSSNSLVSAARIEITFYALGN